MGEAQRTSDEGALDLQAVTPNDGSDLPGGVPRALYVGTAGNITLTTAGYNGVAAHDVLMPNLTAGWHPIACAKRIKATGTTASGIVAAY